VGRDVLVEPPIACVITRWPFDKTARLITDQRDASPYPKIQLPICPSITQKFFIFNFFLIFIEAVGRGIPPFHWTAGLSSCSLLPDSTLLGERRNSFGLGPV
jgi:hypothetical protein